MRPLFCLLLLLAAPAAHAQRFILADSIATPGAYDAQWGDYDADGDMDVLVRGSPRLTVYRSDAGRLVQTTIDAQTRDLAPDGRWADVDGDGRLELVSGDVAYRLTGNILEAVQSGPFCKGMPDLNRDGYEDRITYLSVSNSFSSYSLFVRQPDCSIREVFRRLTQDDTFPSFLTVDLDGDGDLDFLVANELAFNDGTRFPSMPLQPGGPPNVRVVGGLPRTLPVDFDDDGDLDVVVPFDSLRLFAFEDGRYSNTAVKARKVSVGWLYPGDLDGNRSPDLFGLSSSSPSTPPQLIRLTSGGFEVDTLRDLPPITSTLQRKNLMLADATGDGLLDVASLGSDNSFRLWRNSSASAPPRPSAPANLRAVVEGNRVFLSWEGHDPWCTYALRVGTRPGLGDVIGADAAPNGFRLLPGPGNLSTARSVTLPMLAGARTYYWSVQQVSQSDQGSPFAPEASFEVTSTTAAEAASSSGAFALSVAPSPASSTVTVTLGAALPEATTLVVYDLLGHEVERRALSAGEARAALDISALPNGVYVLRATRGGQASHRTFIVAR